MPRRTTDGNPLGHAAFRVRYSGEAAQRPYRGFGSRAISFKLFDSARNDVIVVGLKRNTDRSSYNWKRSRLHLGLYLYKTYRHTSQETRISRGLIVILSITAVYDFQCIQNGVGIYRLPNQIRSALFVSSLIIALDKTSSLPALMGWKASMYRVKNRSFLRL